MGRPKTPRINLNVQKVEKRIKIRSPSGRAADKIIVYKKRRLRQPIYIKKSK